MYTFFLGKETLFKRLTQFLNEKHPTLFSLLDLDLNKTEREWLFWLHQLGYETERTFTKITYGEYRSKTMLGGFWRVFHSSFLQLIDNREEWEKDRWDIRILHDKYGIYYNKISAHYYLDFKDIKSISMRNQVKSYIRNRLLTKDITWGSAHMPIKLRN